MRPTPGFIGRVTRPRTRPLAALAAGALAVGGVLGTALPAAAVGVSVTSTTTNSAASGTATPLAGLGIHNTSGTQQVSLAADQGSLTLTSHANLTLAYGYTWEGPELAFTGEEADINTALATAQFTADDSTDTAHISLATAPYAAGKAFLAANGHYYEFVAGSGITWTNAKADAENATFGGVNGYLAQIPSATVNQFISSKIQNAINVWIGAQAADVGGVRTWTWSGGPLDGEMFTQCSNANGACTHTGDSDKYQSWATGEPNNYLNGESKAVTNWSGSVGRWNDLANNTPQVAGYVIEYGGNTPMTGVASASSTVSVSSWQRGTAAKITQAIAGDKSAGIIWTAARPIGVSVTRYTAVAQPGGASCTTTGTTCVIKNLMNGRVYTVRVTAYDGNGNALTTSAKANVTPRPGVALNPGRIRAGGTASFSAAGFKVASTVVVTRNGAVVARLTANANGVIGPVSIAIPSSARGTVTVTATGPKPLGTGTIVRTDTITVTR